MADVKPWWQSLTIWSAILTGVASFLATFGITLAPSTIEQWAPLLAAIGSVIGPGMAIYGRMRANGGTPVTRAQQTQLAIKSSRLK